MSKSQEADFPDFDYSTEVTRFAIPPKFAECMLSPRYVVENFRLLVVKSCCHFCVFVMSFFMVKLAKVIFNVVDECHVQQEGNKEHQVPDNFCIAQHHLHHVYVALKNLQVIAD